MKKLLILIIIVVIFAILFPSALWAACSGSSPNLTAASASQEHVIECITAATYGDTINVPAGTATWTAASQGCSATSMLCIKKNIKLVGAGSASTIITLDSAPANGAIQYNPDATSISTDGEFEFSGFSVDSGIYDASSGGILRVYNAGSTVITKIKIHDNIFKASPTLIAPGSAWTEHDTNIWKATVTDTLNAYHSVAFDNNYGGQIRANLTELTSNYRWYWEANVLYVYSTSDPDTAFTSPGIRYGNRSSHAIVTEGPVYGVVYSNTMQDIGTAIKVEGRSLASWALGHFSTGTGNSLFFEDNTLAFTSPIIDDYGSSAGQGGSLVFRYNTINAANNVSGNELFDLHGLQSMSSSNSTCNNGCSGTGTCYTETTGGKRCCSEWSQVKSEIYGNSWTNLGNTQGGYTYGLIYRGGKLMYYNNSFTGTYAGGSIPSPKYREYACDECQNPGLQNGGADYVQRINDAYLFNIKYNSTALSLSALSGGDYCYTCVGSYQITENVDYYNYQSSFDGTVGVGCGTLASRPATCTTGVGYWATTQSCSDLTDYVGANPTTPISGTLYKCTSTDTWDSYYTPYTYPHPLRGEGTTQYTLTVTATNCTVTSSPSGINCGSTCTYDYDSGTEVTLSATCSSGYQNAAYSGDCSSATVTMDSSKSCTVACSAIPKTMQGCSFSGGGGVVR